MTTRKTGKSSGPGLWRVYACALAACGALSAGAYLLGVEPIRAEHAAYRADAVELENRHRKASDLAKALQAAGRKLEDTRTEVANLPLRLQPAKAINGRLARLADLAASCGLSVDEMQPGQPTDAPQCQMVPIHIGGNGTYPAAGVFLHQMRLRFPDVGLRTFELTNANPAAVTPVGQFRAELVWFAEPAKK